jgi:hypothetical protein
MIDMTNNRVPYGLLTDEDGMWHPAIPISTDKVVYRTLPIIAEIEGSDAP